MIGDKIAQSVFTERNLPHASALSAILMIAVFLPLLLMMFFRRVCNNINPEAEKTARIGVKK